MLLADDDIKPGVSLSEPVERLVVCESWTDEHNVIKAAEEWACELFHEKLRLATVCRTYDERIEGDVSRFHFSNAQIPTVFAEC